MDDKNQEFIDVEIDQEKQDKKHQKYLNELNVDAKHTMRERIIVGLILTAIVVPCIVFGNYIFAALVGAAAIISCHEVINTPQSIEKRFHRILYVFAYIMMVLMIFYIVFKNNMIDLKHQIDAGTSSNFYFDLTRQFTGIQFSLTWFFISISFFLLTVLFDKNFTIADAFYFTMMLTIVSIGFQSLLYVRYAPFTYSYLIPETSGQTWTFASAPSYFRYGHSILPLFYFLIGVCLNDAYAYFVGVFFGKHKMSPRISPKKSWEGFIGGAILSFITSFGFAWILEASGYPVLVGILDLEHRYNLVIMSIMMPVIAVFGDLIFSGIKRYYGIKDFGKVLRAHGGVLDRLDSVLTTGIAFAILLSVMANNWAIFN
ncbi:MAG: phosphatidate cytidylyltransferase [Bacilli bacterium]|nr:phosphatidate cytidylyltransferase [Bacilli bacterium]